MWGFPRDASGKNLPANAGDVRHMGSIPGSGRPPGLFGPWGGKESDTT